MSLGSCGIANLAILQLGKFSGGGGNKVDAVDRTLEAREQSIQMLNVDGILSTMVRVHLDKKIVEQGKQVDSIGAGTSSTRTGEATLAGGEKNSSNTG
ncbi:hypothetical protein Tco_0651241 [Tanacetum coccineum]